jgi:hypothetical protein
MVRVEGPPRTDEVALGDDGDLFLAVDLAEFYGGDDFASASRVRLAQLKYSTRHPTKGWTAARLAEKRKGTSLVRRLADALRGYLKLYPRDEVVSKLEIALVSNQPADGDLLDALHGAKAELELRGPSPRQSAALLRELPAETQEILKRLWASSGLKYFLRVLSLEECGTQPRAFQRLRLIQELGPSVPGGALEALRGLCDLIRAEAQPERHSSRGIFKPDVLAALHVHSEEALFPAPPRFAATSSIIPTHDQSALAAALVDAAGGRLLAHGDAGVGKTTTTSTLPQALPPNSVVITYDCYGGGDYLNWGGQRHTHERALVQIANELAVRCGTPFLIRPPTGVAELQRVFQRTVEAAATIVAEEGGLLVLTIDAADNAVIAAQSSGTPHDCFVPSLWTMALPGCARLLMTARTHRRGRLGALAGTPEYQLEGFDPIASAIHLRREFLAADDHSCSAFHTNTGGNPRVQYYVLDRVRGACLSLEETLKIAKRTPNEIFEDLWQAAVVHAPDPAIAGQRLALLLALRRPVALDLVGSVWQVSAIEAENFCRALAPGLTLTEGVVALRDEDFETYLRDNVPRRR